MPEAQPIIRTRRIFLSNATSPIGLALLKRAGPSRALLALHCGSAADLSGDPGALVFDLADSARLTTELKSCTTVIHLPESDSLEATKQLVDASVAARIEQFILLSASGASRPIGDYLKSCARAEAVLLASSLRYTIVRPAMATDSAGLGGSASLGLSMLLGRRSLRPMTVEDVALTLLDVAVHQSQLGAIIEGEELYKAAAEAHSHAQRSFAVP